MGSLIDNIRELYNDVCIWIDNRKMWILLCIVVFLAGLLWRTVVV